MHATKKCSYSVCCKDDNKDFIYKSESSLMPIIAEAYYRFSFKVQYRLCKSCFYLKFFGYIYHSLAPDGGAARNETDTNEPYQEAECREAGGVCMKSGDCTSGVADSVLCPRQPKGIDCCLPRPQTTATACKSIFS